MNQEIKESSGNEPNVQAQPPVVAVQTSQISEENPPATAGCAAASCSASGNVISLLEESDAWIECRMPNYNENGKSFVTKQRPQVIQVLIDQMAFQLYGKEYDPILGRLAEQSLESQNEKMRSQK